MGSKIVMVGDIAFGDVVKGFHVYCGSRKVSVTLFDDGGYEETNVVTHEHLENTFHSYIMFVKKRFRNFGV